MGEASPYILGGLGGAGILLVYYGMRQVIDKAREAPVRKRGLWMVNGGVVLIGITLALMLWLK